MREAQERLISASGALVQASFQQAIDFSDENTEKVAGGGWGWMGVSGGEWRMVGVDGGELNGFGGG